jgi:aspartyl-tRNA(Asn)/glutamyl-tRNA(Gln) amidotransferase subunit A
VKGDFTSVDLTKACLAQIKKADKKLKAFTLVTEELALAEAKRVDEKIKKGEKIGLLEGIPVAVKDNMAIDGVRTTAGSKILENYIATYDASVIKKLKDEGMIIIGRTNMDEFAMGSSTESSYFGPTKNPWDTSRVPGGSSGGSAVAAAADECIYALGSDTGGSIRQPASLCGVVGLKPTYGRVSRYGLLAMASSLDQIGPITKTVEDAAIVLEAISGKDKMDSTTVERLDEEPGWAVKDLKKSIKGLRIGVPKEYFGSGMDPEVEQSVREAIKKLEELGAKITEVSLPHAKYGLAVYYILMPSEVSANLARFDGIRYGYSDQGGKNLLEVYLNSRHNGFGEEVRRRIMLGTYTLSSGYYDAYYLQAQKVRTLVKRDFDEVFKKVDCLVTPTSPLPAFKLGEKFGDPLTMYLADIFTVSINVAGVPAISIPCGLTKSNLPIGLQIIGQHFDEETILRAAYNYEQATEWHKKKPKI